LFSGKAGANILGFLAVLWLLVEIYANSLSPAPVCSDRNPNAKDSVRKEKLREGGLTFFIVFLSLILKYYIDNE